MKKLGLLFVAFTLIVACGTKKSALTPSKKTASIKKAKSKNFKQTLRDQYTFVITEISSDKTYGYSPENAVEVGGVKDSEGPLNEQRYLNALTGPNGEEISYFRAGSCCPVPSENAMFGDHAMLDNYRVTWQGSKDTVSIYINMHDSSPLKAPKGFGLRK
ncbi:2-dehydro-3-deoxyphosphooctonate aldolase [Kordia sp.]|uniref:2-dehydro-3-deoxyphosphooctonate aldolase n=1 Tax=Kordia sp. TaxID=1965332 RepID=UPI0025C1AEF6|nr:2-dehydro-3-deoxyphosphooctonate aldolase [Kordia sp.]MCH2194997.1 2-dehydro-3-deoxyphosphooctonate aldolase [Kordia sp.]